MKSAEQILHDKIMNRACLLNQVTDWKKAGNRIVFSNGCFDIVHAGHIQYLSQAAALGEKLVQGLNTDASVKRLKGENRPVLDENARALLLASLFFVDAVCLFDEDTPFELIKSIVPDILVKGKDYKVEEVVGYDIVTSAGGRVETLDLVPGYSTTGIVDKIRKAF